MKKSLKEFWADEMAKTKEDAQDEKSMWWKAFVTIVNTAFIISTIQLWAWLATLVGMAWFTALSAWGLFIGMALAYQKAAKTGITPGDWSKLGYKNMFSDIKHGARKLFHREPKLSTA